jgi:predicted lactoylglutathione lyase
MSYIVILMSFTAWAIFPSIGYAQNKSPSDRHRSVVSVVENIFMAGRYKV